MKHSLAVVVNFCTNESRFIKACLEQTKLFARQVIVPVCDHFFDGKAENRELLERIYQAFPECLFVEYPFIPKKIPKKVFKTVDPSHFWHSLSRFLGAHHVDESIESVLFLDADEVPDGKKVAEWLDASDYHSHTVLKLANYWYFREPCYQASIWEDSVVLVQKKALEKHLLLRQEERDGIYELLPGPKRRHVIGVDGKPMFHHYSWVRTQEEMLRKVESWGHKKDRDWVKVVKEEFTRPFQGTDFVHGYQFQTMDALFGVSLEVPSFEPRGKARVIRLSQERVLDLLGVRSFFTKILDF